MPFLPNNTLGKEGREEIEDKGKRPTKAIKIESQSIAELFRGIIVGGVRWNGLVRGPAAEASHDSLDLSEDASRRPRLRLARQFSLLGQIRISDSSTTSQFFHFRLRYGEDRWKRMSCDTGVNGGFG